MKSHKFSHTHIEHHKDGSHTVHHVHESDPKKDVKHAVPNIDGMHDSMEQNLGAPNQGEGEEAMIANGAGAGGAGPSAAAGTGQAEPKDQ